MGYKSFNLITKPGAFFKAYILFHSTSSVKPRRIKGFGFLGINSAVKKRGIEAMALLFCRGFIIW
jgi:hypothetical protein